MVKRVDPRHAPEGSCRHCGRRPALPPPGSVCAHCWETVKVKYLDFRCNAPDACPHRVTAANVRPA